MTQLVSAERTKLEVKNGRNFFLSRVFGIGRNYSEDTNNEKKDKMKTVLFMKDPFMITRAEEGILYPEDTTQLRYEIELVVFIGMSGSNISPEEVEEYVYGYGVGIDFTKYDAQDIAKKNGWPWDRGKSFFGCAPCSKITPKKEVSLDNNRIWLKKNDLVVQTGTLNQMIWSVSEIVSLISENFGLLAGDVIFTGTPQGVGMVNKGDFLVGGVDGIDTIQVKVK